MNLTRLRMILRRYAPILAVVAIVLVGAISFGTIWYLQQAEGPVAPTAPTSQPSAAQNVCSVEWVVPNRCLSMQVLNAAGQVVAPGADGKITVPTREAAQALRLRCEGLQGTNNVSFRVLKPDNTWETYEKLKTAKITVNLPDPENAVCKKNPTSPDCPKIPTVVRGPIATSTLPLKFGQRTEFEISCKPFAVSFGANKASVDANCRETVVIAATTGGTCSASCSTTEDCGGELICSGGMCRNKDCPTEGDCDCNSGPTPLSCAAGAYDEQFTDSTLDAKVAKGGAGTLTMLNGVGVAEILSSIAADRQVVLGSTSMITGDMHASVDVRDFSSTPGQDVVLGRLALSVEADYPTYQLDWRKGANNASQIVAQQTPATTGGATNVTTPINIPANSVVTLRAIRVGSSLKMYYQIAGQNNVEVATFTTAAALRPRFALANAGTTESTRASVDNFKLICDTDVDNPPGQCAASCSNDDQCGGDLTCNDGMCRNEECTGESDCECDDEEEEDEDYDSVLTVTDLTCTKKDFTATLTLDKDEDPDSGVTVRFTYNGQTITRTTDSDGEASATFTYASGDRELEVDPSGEYDSHRRTIRFNLECPTGTGTPTPTPVASCSKTCVTSSDCSNNLTCSNGMCRNPSCTNDADCVCNQGTPTPSTLPEAGGSTQLFAMVAIGVMVIGLGVTRFKFLKK